MRQKLFFIFVIALGFFISVFFIKLDAPKSKPSPGKLETAATKGGLWLMDYKGLTVDPAILWMMQTMNNNYCGGLASVQSEVQEWTKEFTPDLLNRAFLRLLGGEGDLPSDKDIAAIKDFDDIMLRALYCDQRAVPPETLERIFNVTEADKYNLTHRLWAMQMLKDRSCQVPAPYDLNSTMQKAAERVAAEQATDTVYGDLFAERIAFLEYMGFGDLVRPEWYDKLISMQKESGGWSNPHLWENEPNPHTTALAVWALAQHTNTCPFKQ